MKGTTIYKIISILIILVSCRNIDKKQYDNYIPKYVITSYYNNQDDPENFICAKYYDSSDRLIREIRRESCERFIYDSSGILIETIWGRTCNNGFRKILIFDSLGNHIGYYKTFDSIINMDTVEFEQIKFYDFKNRLIKEKINERIDSNSDTISLWYYYSYNDDKKSKIEIKKNDITIWKRNLEYDSNGRLTESKDVRGNIYEKEYYIYDSLNRLIEKGIKSNGKIITPIGTFDIPHKKTTYSFDSTGFVFKETQFENEKVKLIIINEKKIINNAP